MATARPFAYNTGSTIPGTEQLGNLSIGIPSSGFTDSPQYWNGPDEDLGYVIAQPVPSGDQPNPVGIPAYVGFFRSDALTDNSFLELAEVVADQTFSSPSLAFIWLSNNGYWTNYVPTTPSVTTTPTPTPTNTPSMTQTNTPTNTSSETPTPTPTPTTTSTQTPTPSITASQTQTPTPSITASQTQTPTPSITASQTQTPTTTSTNTPTQTVTPTPNIVTSGLVIQLDAYTNRSYSGGTTVYDITSGYNHTLTNAPYTVLNTIKCFDANGLTTNIRVNGTGPTLPTSGYTYISWVRIKNNSTTYRTLYRTAPNDHPIIVDINTNNLGFYDNDTPPAFYSAGYSVVPIVDTWVQLTVVGDSTGSTFYVNNTLVGTTTKGAGGNRHDYWGSIDGQPFGYVANMYYYNKKLSLSEITQQYNFLSPRFVEPTPTPTTTATQTPTPSITASQTPSPTQTPTRTVTPTQTPTPSITASQTVTPTNTLTPTPTLTPTNPALFQLLNQTTSRTITNASIDGNSVSLTSGNYPIAGGSNGFAATHAATVGVNAVQFDFGGSGAFDLYVYRNGVNQYYLTSYNSSSMVCGGMSASTSDQIVLIITNPGAIATPTPTATLTQTPTNSQTPTNTTTKTPTPTPTSTGLLTSLTYLVVGGGAGGGANWGGGGGAGQVVTGSTNLSGGQTYSINLGNGGNGATGTAQGSNGGTTTFTGTGLSVTAVGGGGGGYNVNPTTGSNGSAGASGGGAGGGGGAISIGGAATAGFSGGSVTTINSGSGGGGGSSQAGANGTTTSSGTGGNGGNGTTFNITGSNVVYAGGGAGGGSSAATAATGGTGGGGNGGVTNGGAGSNATGYGSGGGGGATNSGNGGNGSRGVVILSIPTAQLGTYTGSPIVGLNGANTILTFTGNGTYTAASLAPVTSSLVLFYDPSIASSYPGTGSTINDVSGNGLNGSMTGITFTSPYFSYNGTSSQVRVADNALLEPGSGDWTIEAWVYYSVIAGSQRTFISKTNNGGGASDWSYGLRTTAAGETYMEVGNGGITSVTSPRFTTTTIGQWYQIVGVWTNVASNSIALFVNGISQGSNSHSVTSVLNSTNPLYLGSYNGGEFSQWFNGRMGITRIYSSALTAAQVLQNYNASKSKYGL